VVRAATEDPCRSKKVPWFHSARKPGIIPALAQARHPRSLRLAVQDVALSRLKRGFDSPRERQPLQRVARVGAESRRCVRFPHRARTGGASAKQSQKMGHRAEHRNAWLKILDAAVFGRGPQHGSRASLDRLRGDGARRTTPAVRRHTLRQDVLSLVMYRRACDRYDGRRISGARPGAILRRNRLVNQEQ
jgi:hypothetical protein